MGFIILFPLISTAQSDSLVNQVGTYFGSRTEFLNGCSEALGQQGGLNFRLPLQAPPGTYTLRGIVQEGLDGKMTVASQTMVLP